MKPMTLTLEAERWCESQVHSLNEMMNFDDPHAILEWAEELFAPRLKYHCQPTQADILLLMQISQLKLDCEVLVDRNHFSLFFNILELERLFNIRIREVSDINREMGDCEAWISTDHETDHANPISIHHGFRDVLKINPLAHIENTALEELFNDLPASIEFDHLPRSKPQSTKNRVRSIHLA